LGNVVKHLRSRHRPMDWGPKQLVRRWPRQADLGGKANAIEPKLSGYEPHTRRNWRLRFEIDRESSKVERTSRSLPLDSGAVSLHEGESTLASHQLPKSADSSTKLSRRPNRADLPKPNSFASESWQRSRTTFGHFSHQRSSPTARTSRTSPSREFNAFSNSIRSSLLPSTGWRCFY